MLRVDDSPENVASAQAWGHPGVVSKDAGIGVAGVGCQHHLSIAVCAGTTHLVSLGVTLPCSRVPDLPTAVEEIAFIKGGKGLVPGPLSIRSLHWLFLLSLLQKWKIRDEKASGT